MTSLSQRFNEALKSRKISKKELADAVGVSPSAITQIANGETKELKAAVALKIARTLNVDPWWLVMGEGQLGEPDKSEIEKATRLLKKMPASNLSAVNNILEQLSNLNKI